jgi:cysteine-rich repeat protein
MRTAVLACLGTMLLSGPVGATHATSSKPFTIHVNVHTCGDGIVDVSSACDEDHLEEGDGCDQACYPEHLIVCGDGVAEAPETCDDGNLLSGDGCTSQCRREAVCGNGAKESGEACDDGNTVDGDGCSASCHAE